MCKDIQWSIYKRKDTSQHVILHNLTLQSIALHREMITYTFIRPCNYTYGNVEFICMDLCNYREYMENTLGRSRHMASPPVPFRPRLHPSRPIFPWWPGGVAPQANHTKTRGETQSPSSRWYSSSPNPLWRTWLASQDSKTLVLRLRWGWGPTKLYQSHSRKMVVPPWVTFL